jgi:hypothetical protein
VEPIGRKILETSGEVPVLKGFYFEETSKRIVG